MNPELVEAFVPIQDLLRRVDDILQQIQKNKDAHEEKQQAGRPVVETKNNNFIQSVDELFLN